MVSHHKMVSPQNDKTLGRPLPLSDATETYTLFIKSSTVLYPSVYFTGNLRKAAEMKRDEDVLRHIRGKDCVAIEVKYHRACFKKYTRIATTSLNEK